MRTTVNARRKFECFADDDEFRSNWDPVTKRVRAALVDLKGTGFSRSVPRLRRLYIDLKADAEKVGFK
jgi:hypothetical protein